MYTGFEKHLMGFGRLGSKPLKEATSVRILCPNYHDNCYEDNTIVAYGLCAGCSSFAPPPDWMTQSHNMEAIDLVSESDDDEDEHEDVATAPTEPTRKKGST